MGRAFGAHGECVTEPDDLAAAIDRCLAALEDGKAAVMERLETEILGTLGISDPYAEPVAAKVAPAREKGRRR